MLKQKTLVFLSTFAVIALWSAAAFAADAGAADNIFTTYSWIAIGAGLGIGLAAVGGAIGMGNAAGSALGGIARNPGAAGKIFTPFIIALALIEALAIYAFVISILLVLEIEVDGLIEMTINAAG